MGYQEEVADDKLTEKIIAVAIEVHNALSNDLPEEVYRDALCHGLREDGLEVEAEYEVDVRFRGKVVAQRYVDLLVEDEVVVELKATKRSTDEHYDQLGTNLRAAGGSRGLLLNFGMSSLHIRRRANNYNRDDDADQ